MIKIQFLGAVGGVTGSSYLLSANTGESILVDLGMFQGEDDKNQVNFSPLAFDTRSLKAVLLTHAHLDHCGRLPLLIKQGFNGRIYTTDATKEITILALKDAAEIAKEKIGPLLYTKEEVLKVIDKITTVSYDSPFNIGGFSINFRNAGHILGSASIEVNENGHTIVFSGDLGNTPEDLIKPTEYIPHSDFVVMESTYGDKTHPEEDILGVLAQEIIAIEQTSGVLLIPAFSIERSQEIIHRLGHLIKEHKISSNIPIFLDSPMAISVIEIFKKYPHHYNSELAKDTNPFQFSSLKLTKSVQDSKAILKTRGPKVIIAGSGMMSGGRIMHHLYNYLSRPSTRLLVVGYQAVGTLGREILDGAKQVIINKTQINVRAKITDLEALSSHADQPRLITWLKQIQGVKKVFITHGEDMPRQILAEKIKTDLKIADIILPVKDQIYELT